MHMHVYLWVRQLATGVMTAPAPDLHCYKVSGDVLRGFLTQICNCVFYGQLEPDTEC